MKIEVQRKIDRIVGPFLCRLLSFIKKKKIQTETRPKKILVILLSEMGSLVLARPMLDYIGVKYAGASVYVMLFEKNREVLELLDVVPAENILSITDSSLKRFVVGSIYTLIKLRQMKIDTVIDCELFARVSSIFAFLSGAKIRVGFHPHTQEGLYRGDFINRPVPYNPYNHISQQFITLADSINSDTTPKAKRKMPVTPLEMTPFKVDRSEVNNFCKRVNIDFPEVEGKRLVLVYPGGGLLPIRAWPLENYCTVSKKLIEKGYAVGIIGLEEDKKHAKEIQSHCKSMLCADFTGYTKTVKELILFFHFASLLITNDGGPVQFASMTPIPAITLYGPETPDLYGALNYNVYNFYIPLSCSPCLTAYNHRNSPCDGDNLCLKNIRPEDVLEKAFELIEDDNSLIQ